jgi:ribosomal protein S18 acetylase RimI-like enzyme
VSSARVNSVSVRPGVAADLDDPAIGGPIGEYRPQLAAVMRSDTGLVLVAEVDSEIVGRITLGSTGNDADISGFVVIKRRRRQGIGMTLMDAAEDEARRRGCRRLRLTVAKDNSGAIALYAARGYQRVAQGVSAGLTTPEGVVVHEPEPVWEMIKPVRAGI